MLLKKESKQMHPEPLPLEMIYTAVVILISGAVR